MKTRGFTLIDLMVTIAILGILGFIGIPSLQSALESSRASSVSRLLYTSIQQARTIALSQSKRVILCGSNDGITCQKTWNEYILIFTDENKNKIADPNEIYSQQPVKQKGNLITRVSFGSSHTVFNANGYTEMVGSIIYCPSSRNSKYMRRATWNRMGRPYLGRHINAEGLIDEISGKSLPELCN